MGVYKGAAVILCEPYIYTDRRGGAHIYTGGQTAPVGDGNKDIHVHISDNFELLYKQKIHIQEDKTETVIGIC